VIRTVLCVGLTALLTVGGCGRKAACYDDGYLDCESGIQPLPGGNLTCQTMYVEGYDQCLVDLGYTVVDSGV
jgi:hypothetical protein